MSNFFTLKFKTWATNLSLSLDIVLWDVWGEGGIMWGQYDLGSEVICRDWGMSSGTRGKPRGAPSLHIARCVDRQDNFRGEPERTGACGFSLGSTLLAKPGNLKPYIHCGENFGEVEVRKHPDNCMGPQGVLSPGKYKLLFIQL